MNRDSSPASIRPLLLSLLLASLLAGCAATQPAPDPAHGHDESWSVTAWGERYEIFPEVDLLVAGESAVSHTHVTRLDGFAPLVDGAVEIVLSGPAGEEVFRQETPVRPGIFSVEIAPATAGERELTFRIHGPDGAEEIAGGTVRVGTADEPGGLVRAPGADGRAPGTAPADAAEPQSFLKEQQWRTGFATEWVRPGRLPRSVSGLARVRPPAGGEIVLTAPVDGVLTSTAEPSEGWPFVGQSVGEGAALFRIVPHVATERSLASLEAEVGAIEAELEPARSRLARLEELWDLDATSRREVEEARARVETLAVRRSATAADLDAARSARSGGFGGSGAAGEALTVRAPFAGQIARVVATPGTTVTAGENLGRLVRTDRVWIEVAVAPSGATHLATQGVHGVVLSSPEKAPVHVSDGLRVVSIAPEMSARTGTVAVLLEVPARPDLVLGTTRAAHLLSNEALEGIVIPAGALIDDGGIPVVYTQRSGEEFVRREVEVLERQGELALVDHLPAGLRLVTRGGDAIRRSSLMASGAAEGHVH